MVKKGKKSNIYAESKIKKMNAKHPLSQPQKRNFRLGNHIKPSIIKARFVKWPRYVRLQRQKRILFRRLKVPAAIAQFCSPLDKSNTSTLLKALAKYTPETRKQKLDRIKAKAQAKATKGKESGSDKPLTIKFGLNHVTHLIEQKKAKLVIIASDVDPIENVVFLPTLCKAMDIPYCIVNNKSRLGELVHKKTATVLAVTDFKLAANDFSNIVRVCKESFNNAHPRVKNPEKGIKSTIREIKLRKLLNAEEAKKNNN
jgi:large subunit ribosomal protein L7Ae